MKHCTVVVCSFFFFIRTFSEPAWFCNWTDKWLFNIEQLSIFFFLYEEGKKMFHASVFIFRCDQWCVVTKWISTDSAYRCMQFSFRTVYRLLKVEIYRTEKFNKKKNEHTFPAAVMEHRFRWIIFSLVQFSMLLLPFFFPIHSFIHSFNCKVWIFAVFGFCSILIHYIKY